VPTEHDLRAELIQACKVLYRAGVTDLAGHITVNLERFGYGANRFLIKPRGVSWYKLSAKDLKIMNEKGVEEGKPGSPPIVTEWPLHTEVYKARSDVVCVLHAHPEDSTLVASLDLDWEPLTRNLFFYARGLPVFDNEVNLREEDALIQTEDRARQVARHLGRDPALILKYHGTVVAANTIGGVVVASYLLEQASRSLLKAAATNKLPKMDPSLQNAMMYDRNATPFGTPDLVKERWEMLKGYYLP
jgi:L-fuculose-phosphate aldolase